MISIHTWLIPTSLSIVVAAIVLFWPEPASRGDYDFTGAFLAIFKLGGAIIALLMIWLIYFAVR